MNIFYNGTDIINDVSVLYCVHDMHAEKEADTLVIRFEDTAGNWSRWAPAPGDEIRLTEEAADTGKMFVHSLRPENGIFTIRAMSMPGSGSTRQSKSWEGVRFFQMGHEIAGKHGLTFQTYGCTDQVYMHLRQENETDFALFSRLCMLEGCQMLIYDGKLLAYNEQYMENQEPAATLEVSEKMNFAYQDTRAAGYGSCEISSGSFYGKFEEPDSARTPVLRPVKALRASSNAEAARFAKGLLRNVNKYGQTGLLSGELMTDYAAASLLELQNEKASAWDGPAFLYRVRHDYVTRRSTLYFRKPLEGY